MGITFGLIDRLRTVGVFAAKPCRVLDIGSSNLYQADAAGVSAFVRSFTTEPASPQLDEFAQRLAKGSGYDPVKGGLNEAFIGELIERCGMQYLSFDIAQGYKTEVVDLNVAELPEHHRETYDVVMNIGTTEHVLNQYNSFRLIHEATRVGGFMVHQLPVAGFTDHGYFVYTGRMFFDLASFNKYEIVDLWYDGPAGNDELYASPRAYANYFPRLRTFADASLAVPNAAMTIVYRRTTPNAFGACLETSTSVGKIPAAITSEYFNSPVQRARHAIRGTALGRVIRRLLGR